MSCEDTANSNGRAAVFFVGNRLMLDDGVGPAAYDAFLEQFEVEEAVALFDVGCMTMDLVNYVKNCRFVMSVDAIEGSDQPAGTVFRFTPDDAARHGMIPSLHDLKLSDLFDAAALLGYTAEGLCLGMQVQDCEPREYIVGLTPACQAALPLLVEAVAAELVKQGYRVTRKQTQEVLHV